MRGGGHATMLSFLFYFCMLSIVLSSSFQRSYISSGTRRHHRDDISTKITLPTSNEESKVIDHDANSQRNEVEDSLRRTLSTDFNWDVAFVSGSASFDYKSDGSDHGAQMIWTKTLGRNHVVELYEKGCNQKIELDPMNGPFASVATTDLENVYNPSDVGIQYFAVDITMKSDIRSTSYFNVVADDTARIGFCVRADLILDGEVSPNVFATTSINFEFVEMTLELDLETVAIFSIDGGITTQRDGPNNCYGFYQLKERSEYTWDDFQDYALCGRYACLREYLTDDNKMKVRTSMHFPLFMESDLDQPSKGDFEITFYRPGCHVAIPNSVLSTDIIFPEVLDGDTEENTPDIVVVGYWHNNKIKLEPKLLEKKIGKDPILNVCLIIRRNCLDSLPSQPTSDRRAVEIGDNYIEMIVESRISVTLDDNGDITGYDPSDDTSTYQVSHVGDNNTGVVLGAQVDYDFGACQCNPYTLECEPSTLGNGGTLHLCFHFTNQPTNSGLVWAGVNYLFLSNSEIERTSINNKIPDDFTAIFNAGTEVMRVSTMLTSAFFEPAMTLSVSGTVLLGFGSTNRRLDFSVDLPNSHPQQQDVSTSVFSDFFYWTNTIEPDHQRRQLLEKRPRNLFNIQVELAEKPEDNGGNNRTAPISDEKNKRDAYQRAGTVFVGSSLLFTCIVLAIVKQKADQEDEQMLRPVVHKGPVMV